MTFIETILLCIIASYFIFNAYKNHGIKNTILIITGGIILAFLTPFSTKYISMKLTENTITIILILLIGFFIGLLFWKNNKEQ